MWPKLWRRLSIPLERDLGKRADINCCSTNSYVKSFEGSDPCLQNETWAEIRHVFKTSQAQRMCVSTIQISSSITICFLCLSAFLNTDQNEYDGRSCVQNMTNTNKCVQIIKTTLYLSKRDLNRTNGMCPKFIRADACVFEPLKKYTYDDQMFSLHFCPSQSRINARKRTWKIHVSKYSKAQKHVYSSGSKARVRVHYVLSTFLHFSRSNISPKRTHKEHLSKSPQWLIHVCSNDSKIYLINTLCSLCLSVFLKMEHIFKIDLKQHYVSKFPEH
jgi:hypothetical protein